jgi:hypothetical protein
MRGIVGVGCTLALAGCGGGHDGETYTLHSRLLGRDLKQVVVPEGRGRPLLVFLHGRGADPGRLLGGDLDRALLALGRRAPNVRFPSGGESSY